MLFVVFCFSLFAWCIFSMPNDIPISSRYILTTCIRLSHSFSFLANSLMSSMYIRGLIFSCDLVSLYRPAHFLSMWLTGIITIINSNGVSVFPWKIPLRIFKSAKLFFSYCQFYSLVFHCSLNKLYYFIRYLVHFEFIIQLCGTILYGYHFFGLLKEGLRGNASDKEVKTTVMKSLKEQSTEFYKAGMHGLIEGGTSLVRETMTMLRSRDVIHIEPASF